jgi:hypothetical protein
MKDSNKLFKKLGFIAVGLCAACCLLPIVGVLLGMGALTILTGFLEWAGILAMIAAIVFLGVYYFKSKRAPVCDIECACTEDKKASATKQ